YVAAYFVASVVGIAILTLIVWGLYGPEPSWSYGLINAVAVLIIACPCALGLATPMSVMVATGKAATRGILFRDASAIEHFRQVDTLILDKTGTLTEGKPRLYRVLAAEGYTEQEILHLAASLDQGSEHPLADAIVNAAQECGLVLDKAEDFESGSGIGVSGSVAGKHLLLGNQALMDKAGVNIESFTAQIETLSAQGASVMMLAVNGKIAGLLAVSDPIKASTAEAITTLKASGIRLIMASGDGLITAKAVAET